MKKTKKLICSLLTVGILATGFAGSALAAESKEGQWKRNKTGWWYSFSDGSYAKNQWLKIGKKWYFFNGKGYMVTGWKKSGGKWYYLSNSGAMATGWRKINNKWYYLDKKSGAMVTGWLEQGEFQYYLLDDGSMATGHVEVGDAWLDFDDDGHLIPAENNVGAWIDTTPGFVPDEAQAVFDKAMENLDGASYEMMGYMGSQLVAGKNYRFLCKQTLVTAEPVTKYVIITLYEDLEGNVTLTDVLKAENTDVPVAGLAGGYTEPISIFLSSNDITIDNALKALLEATGELDGAQYNPLAVLGVQVVAGTNYRILCEITPVVPNAEAHFSIVTVYKPLEGAASITGTDDFVDESKVEE